MTLVRRLLAMLAVAAVALTLVAVVQAPALAVRPAGYTTQARTATDAARAQEGLPRLARHGCLQRAAQRQADRMARSGRLSHSPDFRRLGRRCGLSTWGENVAQAPGSDRGRGVVRQWMGSSGHRANILNRQYRLLGLAAVRRHGWWWVVQVFGRRG
jgi:uncharacterized protein YkwD